MALSKQPKGSQQLTDILSRDKRSWNMSRIRGKNTKPEMVVRSMLHRMGYRFRLYVSKLPGKPDIVLPKYRTVIFVHGCFWHRHPGCKYAYNPKTRQDFWKNKFEQNVARHQDVAQRLEELGWRVAIIWECEIDRPDYLKELILQILSEGTGDVA